MCCLLAVQICTYSSRCVINLLAIHIYTDTRLTKVLADRTLHIAGYLVVLVIIIMLLFSLLFLLLCPYIVLIR